MRVLLVDDHAMVRAGVRRILADSIEGSVFGEATSGEEAVARVGGEPWDVVVLDLSLAGRSGLETIKDILHLHPAMRVLVLTMHGEEEYALRAFRAGAAGYVTKASSPDDLVAAVRKVAGGGKYVTGAAADALVSRLSSGERPLHDALSDRELQVLRLIASGKTVKEIGSMLTLSAKTISTYRTRILEKLQLRSTPQLVLYALSAGLVDPGAESSRGAPP